eukprot:m.173245 g.173245  ORF g.173245 m.173245 type:complete len:87 (+) comp16526_c2_seq5:237-497(+)
MDILRADPSKRAVREIGELITKGASEDNLHQKSDKYSGLGNYAYVPTTSVGSSKTHASSAAKRAQVCGDTPHLWQYLELQLEETPI